MKGIIGIAAALVVWLGVFAAAFSAWRRFVTGSRLETRDDIASAFQRSVASILHGIALAVLLSWVYAALKSAQYADSGGIVALYAVFACGALDVWWIARVWAFSNGLEEQLEGVKEIGHSNIPVRRWPGVTVIAGIIVVLLAVLSVVGMLVISSLP